MAAITGGTDPHRGCSGSPGGSAIREIYIAGKTLGPRGWGITSGRTAMAVPAAVPAIIMAAVRSKAPRMGKGDCRNDG
ncbi:hypothetical protein GCM10010833_08080 [Blastomonas aquatica]|uniref:Uncharacterized protein n=1 Tax=Blastomonas aquatica TaxID=1510276 RepID=A0ABQ1IYP9_9SPHN|nr:hypothetical protein GCM10010833_08080 [Blastomonas aquatica]